MKAALYTRYGPPEVVELADTDKPSATEKQVLLRVTALQGLRRGGLDANTPPIQPRRKVLVNGASGDVGTFAAKIAHTFGAEVTGVCSIRNLELVFQLGATRVID
jgi:NADPH:quinone reductase-like Zn-dependent oxidoreductase